MSHDERLFELISALVDGELTPDEEARAQQLLASSAELRRYRDELFEMRSAFEKLPRLQLPESFSQQVLRRAEREMLLQGGQHTNGHSKQVNQANSVPLVASAAASSASGKRSLLRRSAPWLAVLAAAAAIALVVVLQQQNHNPRLARQKSKASTTGIASDRHDQQRQANRETAPEQGSTVDLATDSPEPRSSNASSSDPRTPDPISTEESTPGSTDLVNVSPGEVPPVDGANQGELQMPLFAWLCEVVLTSQGIQERTFEQALSRAGIDLHNAIPVDRGMESTLLAHKYFGGIKPEDLPTDGLPYGADSARDHLELIFLVCTGPQFDDLRTDLEQQPGYILAVKDDMVSATSDLMLYSEIQELASNGVNPPANFVGAHPLVMEEKLRERLLVALRDSKMAKEPVPEINIEPQPDPMPQDQEPAVNDAPPDMSAHMAELMQMQHMILVVLRSADTLQAAP